jgi:hypothetical protein
MGDNWGLFMMVPPNGSYFVYDGSLPVPNCDAAKCIVFKSMLNIDANDFALLVKNVTPGSRPIQGLGDREVFFNDTEQLAGGPIPHDNKTYMRCKRSPRKGGDVKKVTQVDVSGEKTKKTTGPLGHAHKFLSDQIAANGTLSVIDGVVMIASFIIAVYVSYTYNEQFSFFMGLNGLSQRFAAWIRSFVVKNVPFTTSSSVVPPKDV